MIRAFVRFWFKRNTENWRALRRECRNALPRAERKAVEENGE